jgi:dynein heavy chain, axonemal
VAPEGFLKVNFDPVLVRLLREVKYLSLLDIGVPERASNIYKKVNVYRS